MFPEDQDMPSSAYRVTWRGADPSNIAVNTERDGLSLTRQSNMVQRVGAN